MRIVPLNCITKEITLAKTIYNSKGNILLRKGVLITPSLIKKIRLAEITTIYIDDGYSNVEIEDILKPEIKHAAIKTIKDTFKAIKNTLGHNANEKPNLQSRLKNKVMNKYLDKLKNISEAVINDIISSHHALVNIVDIKHIGNYTYEHSLSVAVLALVIGIEMRLSRHDLYCLFIGAVLHDLGKVFISKEILEMGDNMTEESLELYKKHSLDGYSYTRENHGLSATSKIVILQHHEHFDGSGYPNGTYGLNIHKFSRIVAICDAYDKMTSDGPNSPALPPNDVIEYLMASAGSKFDFDIVNLFIRKINPYPIGTLITLSNNETAVVINNNINFPMRPIVQVISIVNGKPMKKEVFDLLVRNDITISEIRYKDLNDNE